MGGYGSHNNINSDRSFDTYLPKPLDSVFQFQNITEHTTLSIIKRLKNKDSSGIDGISNNLIKHIHLEIAKPLTLIINQMINSGIFPSELKISKVTPIYKANEKDLFSNYRPISLLPSISKFSSM